MALQKNAVETAYQCWRRWHPPHRSPPHRRQSCCDVSPSRATCPFTSASLDKVGGGGRSRQRCVAASPASAHGENTEKSLLVSQSHTKRLLQQCASFAVPECLDIVFLFIIHKPPPPANTHAHAHHSEEPKIEARGGRLLRIHTLVRSRATHAERLGCGAWCVVCGLPERMQLGHKLVHLLAQLLRRNARRLKRQAGGKRTGE